MTRGPIQSKIKPEHLARRAIVYLPAIERQAGAANISGGPSLEYDVAERMRALGLTQVETVDRDLRSSAAMASLACAKDLSVSSVGGLGRLGAL